MNKITHTIQTLTNFLTTNAKDIINKIIITCISTTAMAIIKTTITRIRNEGGWNKEIRQLKKRQKREIKDLHLKHKIQILEIRRKQLK